MNLIRNNSGSFAHNGMHDRQWNHQNEPNFERNNCKKWDKMISSFFWFHWNLIFNIYILKHFFLFSKWMFTYMNRSTNSSFMTNWYGSCFVFLLPLSTEPLLIITNKFQWKSFVCISYQWIMQFVCVWYLVRTIFIRRHWIDTDCIWRLKWYQRQ